MNNPSPIAVRRAERCMTQEQLAVASGVATKTVRNIEQCRCKTTHKSSTLAKIANVLGCAVSDLAPQRAEGKSRENSTQ